MRKIRNVHERVVAGEPEQIARVIADFDEIWPEHVAPAPRYVGDGVYAADPMIWEETTRPGAARAFRVIHPPELEAEHWFEVLPAPTGTLVRHIVAGEAHADLAAAWRDRIEPVNDRILEPLLDRVAAKSVTFDSRGGSYRS